MEPCTGHEAYIKKKKKSLGLTPRDSLLTGVPRGPFLISMQVIQMHVVGPGLNKPSLKPPVSQHSDLKAALSSVLALVLGFGGASFDPSHSSLTLQVPF